MTQEALAPDHRWVDEDRILSQVMPRMFQRGWPVVAELMQNCYRARVSRVDLTYSHAPDTPWANPDDARPSERNSLRSIAIQDDGPGLPTLDALRDFLTVGASGFEEDWSDALPAGMGFYSLLAQAKQVTLTSGFGRVVLDAPRWLQDTSYRAGLFADVDESQARDGLHIMATDCDGLPDDTTMRYRRQRLGLYANTMYIRVNGVVIMPVQPKRLLPPLPRLGRDASVVGQQEERFRPVWRVGCVVDGQPEKPHVHVVVRACRRQGCQLQHPPG